MKKPEGYSGPEIQIVLKDSKMAPDQLKDLLTKLIKENLPAGGKVAIFQKNEKVDGPLTQTLLDCLKEGRFTLTEMMETMGLISRTKIQSEIDNMKVSAAFVEWTTKKLIKEIEDNIDGGIAIKHSKIAALVERYIDNPDKIRAFNQKYHFNVDPEGQLLDFPLGVLV
jgi:nucleosome binding factor SPN SPT16 subunit